MNQRVEILLRLLDSVHTKSRWHSLKSALKGLTEEQAQWTPTGHKGFPFMSGSIIDIVFHVGADQLIQVSQRFGDKSLTWEVMTNRFNHEGRTLAAALKFLHEGHETLSRTLAALSDDELNEEIAIDNQRMSNEDFFIMMIEHGAYHAGQIRYIRNLLDGMTA